MTYAYLPLGWNAKWRGPEPGATFVKGGSFAVRDALAGSRRYESIWSSPRSGTKRNRPSAESTTACACGPRCRLGSTLEPLCFITTAASLSRPSALKGNAATVPVDGQERRIGYLGRQSHG